MDRLAPLEHSWKLSEITLEAQTVPLDGELLQVQVRRLPGNQRPWDAELLASVSPTSEAGPLWVRVTQTDGHRAWASPLFVEGDTDLTAAGASGKNE